MAGKNGLSLHADDLRAMGKDVAEVLQQLDPKKAEELRYNYRFWARPEQVPPEEGEWNVFLALAGRGWGKTWAGAQWCREQVKLGKRRVMAVAATNADLERVLVKGESGFLSVCWAGDKTYKGVHMGYPEWSPTKRTLTWANGATVTFYSSEEPDRLRGPQGDAAWLDELCAWNKDRETYDMLQFCLRLGKHPRIFITTTPKPTRLLRDILKSPKTLTVRGSTFDNAANLASTYLEAVKTQYEGTRLGRQELYAEVLDEAGALRSLRADLPLLGHEFQQRGRHRLRMPGAGTRVLTRAGMYWLVRRAFEATGQKIGPHDLRHTSATHTAGSISETDRMLIYGWKDPAMARHYSRQAAQQNAIEAHRKASPLEKLGR